MSSNIIKLSISFKLAFLQCSNVTMLFNMLLDCLADIRRWMVGSPPPNKKQNSVLYKALSVSQGLTSVSVSDDTFGDGDCNNITVVSLRFYSKLRPRQYTTHIQAIIIDKKPM